MTAIKQLTELIGGLNPKCNQIGAGMMAQLKDLALLAALEEQVAYPGWEACQAYDWNEHLYRLVVITNAPEADIIAAFAEFHDKQQAGHQENIEAILNRRGFFASVGNR